MADPAAVTLFREVEAYVARAVRPYVDKLAEIEARHALDVADLKAQLAAARADTQPQIEVLAAAIADAVARHPAPRDGRDGQAGSPGEPGRQGEKGVPGADAVVDYDRIGEVIAVAVAKEVGKYPVPRDGRDGKDGKDGAPGRDGVDGKDGAAGRDGINGIDGKDAPAVDEESIAGRILAALPAPRDGKDGRDGLQGERGLQGDPGPAGADGEAGRDGRDGDPGPTGEKGADGRDGRDGFTPADWELDYCVDSGEIVVRAKAGARVIERRIAPGLLHDAGVYQRGRTYRKGAVVTFAGSAFTAQRDTSAPLGGDAPSADWRLLVKRGRDGNGA